MNILIFVMTLLMLLTIMTYGRWESYRSSQLFQTVFEHYIQNIEHGYTQEIAKKAYDGITVRSKDEKKDEKGKPKNKPSEGLPRLSLKELVDKNLRSTKEEDWTQKRIILKQLINALYANQPFYKKMEESHPNFVEDLINTLIQTIDALPKEKKWKNPSELANLRLPDPELDDVFYKILNGAPYVDILEQENKEALPSLEENKTEEKTQEDNGSEFDTSEEYKSLPGYYSLLDFITFKPSSKVRIYLAPKELLQSIFPNADTVDAIMSERRKLYQEVNRGISAEDLSNAFKASFENAKHPNIKSDSLDFTVSKTDPKKYE